MTDQQISTKCGQRVFQKALERIQHSAHVVSLALLLAVALSSPLAAQTGTPMPVPIFQGVDNAGNPVANGRLCTYVAGTTTPAATYTSSALNVANTPPPTGTSLDSAGRAVVFLTPGQSFKFVLLSATSTDCSTGTTIWTVDGILAVPSSSANLDVLGTAGEAITAGQVVYLSDGSGSKTAGQWFIASNLNPYSSTAGVVGMAPNAITSGTAGTIRLAGQMTGLTSLGLGSTYYLSTAGALTATPPTNNIRVMGMADSTSSLILNDNPYQPPLTIATCNGRLTLTSGVPVTTADVTAAGTVFFTPYQGNRCALYDGTRWTVRTFAQLSATVPAVASKMYDVFYEDTAGTLGIEVLAWTNDTTRATALANQDGVLVKTGDLTRRYLGSFRTTSTPSQTEDSAVNRFVWNNYNRVTRSMRRQETTGTWNYTTNTFQQANASALNELQFVIGVAEEWVQATATGVAANGTNSVDVAIAIGDNSTTAAATGCVQGFSTVPGAVAANANVQMTAWLLQAPAAGYHNWVWLEKSGAAGTTTWQGTISSGIQATLRN